MPRPIYNILKKSMYVALQKMSDYIVEDKVTEEDDEALDAISYLQLYILDEM